MKLIKTISLFLSLSTLLLAQERMILRTNGEKIKINAHKDLREAITESKIKRSDGTFFNSHFVNTSQTMGYNEDTLSYRQVGGTWNTNFGFFGQDVMMMWFEAPADMIIEGIGFTCSDDTGADNATISLRLLRLNWTKDMLQNFSEDQHIGYYPSNGDGFNNVDYFGEFATGNWISKDENNTLPPWTNNENPDSNTFQYDLWSDHGFGFPITPVASPFTDPVYQWVETNELENQPEISRGEIFAIVATHDGTNLDDDRIGFRSDNSLGYPGWKYYENGRSDATVDQGWWTRLYTWDFAVAVDITSCLPPYIRIVQPLITTLSIEPQEVCAEVDADFDCYGGRDSVLVELVYVLNDIDTNRVLMTSSDNFNFCADIPGQSPRTSISYWVEVTDNTGWKFTSQEYTYKIFAPTPGITNLVVINGNQATSGYPTDYYWGPDCCYFDTTFLYDTWAYGSLTKELVDNYIDIYEITTEGPNSYHKDVVKAWLEADGSRNYLLAGEEWLGAGNGYVDVDYVAGDFEFDVLGITHSYNDVSYDGTSGQELPSRFFPQQGTLLGDAMYVKAATINEVDSTSIDSIIYNPMYEIGTVSNWHDGFEVAADVEVFMKAETRGIAGVPMVREVAVGANRETSNGNKVVFMAYDPISIDSAPTYSWLGRGTQSNTYRAMKWFNYFFIDIWDNVKDDLDNIKFSLSQNYPNPFNPSTTIKYSIGTTEVTSRDLSLQNVQLIIYDILGREVATLVNKEQKPGNYEVQFDGKRLTSGVYFYKLISGSFIESKKMLLLK